MSQANVEIVRRALEAWQRDDFDTWLSACDPDIEWHPGLERLVEGTESTYRGHEGMRRFWRAYRTELENFEVEAQELRDAGDDRVVILGGFRWARPVERDRGRVARWLRRHRSRREDRPL
jgi:ketosteroid isomerase-like protein